MTTLEGQEYEIIRSEEYKAYLKALCRYASGYVSRIRVQFAERAYEKYQDPTTRRIVLAYGEEIEKLDADRLRQFESASRYGALTEESLNDSCLIHAGAYGETIKLLFDIGTK